MDAGVLCGEGEALVRMGEPDELGEVCHAAKLIAQVVKYHSHVSLPEYDTALVKYGVKSPKFIWFPVYSCTGTHWLRPCSPPRTSALLVSHDRRHLFEPSATHILYSYVLDTERVQRANKNYVTVLLVKTLRLKEKACSWTGSVRYTLC